MDTDEIRYEEIRGLWTVVLEKKAEDKLDG